MARKCSSDALGDRLVNSVIEATTSSSLGGMSSMLLDPRSRNRMGGVPRGRIMQCNRASIITKKSEFKIDRRLAEQGLVI